MKLYYVYILKCSDATYYTGMTNNLDRRVIQHQDGYNRDSYTFKRRPVELVFFHEFTDVNQAISFEKQLKGWNRRKKEAIISGDWNQLIELAKCRNETSHLRYELRKKRKVDKD